jgi:hypothetical protein
VNRPIFLLALLPLLAPLVAAAADNQVDGPGARFDDDLISRLEGRWLLTRKIRGTEVHNVVSATWVLNHQFLRIHMKDVKQPASYEAIVLIGYIHSSKQYIAHWTDTYGGKFSAIGRGTRAGNSIEFRFEYPDGPFFNTFAWTPEQQSRRGRYAPAIRYRHTDSRTMTAKRDPGSRGTSPTCVYGHRRPFILRVIGHELGCAVRIMNRGRRYASFFEWTQKVLGELGVVEELVASIAASRFRPRHEPIIIRPDVPDCVCTGAGAVAWRSRSLMLFASEPWN